MNPVKPNLFLDKRYRGFANSIFLLTIFALGLSFYRWVATGTFHLWFLAWNLFLAWVPLVFAWLLYRRTATGLFWSWKNFWLGLGWILFLPNAFYLVTDFIHLDKYYHDINIVYDIVLLATYTVAGLVVGYTSLLMVHLRAIQKYGNKAHFMVALTLLLCGFAIYLGRYLRWNSWSIITSPLRLLFEASDSIVSPDAYRLTLMTTLLFFGFLSVVYLVIWRAVALVYNSAEH